MKTIYKGEKYEITTDGIRAYKTGGTTKREMPFFPERDIEALAGDIDEETAWRIVLAVANGWEEKPTPINPAHILIADEGFMVSEWSESTDNRFEAPEGYCAVWALGATTFYMTMGCHVFHGLGGKAQTPSTPVPLLRKDYPELNALVGACLQYEKAKRPEMGSIAGIALKNIERLGKMSQERRKKKNIENGQEGRTELENLWPDEMK